MIEIGQYDELKVEKEVDFGVFLQKGEDRVLLPKKYVPAGTKAGDLVKVFIYCDSEDRIIATTLTPHAIVGEFAYLRAVEVNQFGAFLDWGIPKDLFVPFKEQKLRMDPGKHYFVRLYLDEDTMRVAASAKIEKFLEKIISDLEEMEQVEVIIWSKTDIGYKAIVNNKYAGLIYANEVFKPLLTGEKMNAFVKKIRDDGKIDLTLQKPGYDAIASNADNILNKLEMMHGFLPLNDDSSPEEIYKMLHISKKVFKKSIGTLYRQKKIEITPNGIKLINKKNI